MSNPANKKKKAIARTTKKSSIIDRLRFMQKERPSQKVKENGANQSSLVRNGEEGEMPEFFQMVQNASKQALKVVNDKNQKDQELWQKLNLQSNYDRKNCQ